MTYSSRINVFVGTAYSGENEFDECIKRIDSQKGVLIHHYIVFDKPILPAFDEMYGEWSNCKNNMDMFIQVDADVLLYDDDCIISIFNKIKDTKYNVISYPLFDHFTNRNIWGLNSYLPSIRFNKLKDKYKPDMEFSNAKRYPTDLTFKAKGEHAPNPSIRHAFHFGWHRELRADPSPGQINILKSLFKAPSTSSREHAKAGVLAARKYKNTHKDISPIEYTNTVFLKELEKYEQTQRINRTI